MTLIEAALNWAKARENYIAAAQEQHKIGDENVKLRGGKTQEYGEAYRASGQAAKELFEAEVVLLDAAKAFERGIVTE